MNLMMKKEIKTDIIKEYTSGEGVMIGGVLIKNGEISGYSQGNTSSQYTYFKDPVSSLKYRIGVRSNILVTDKELTLTGFNGIENTDWENVQK